MRAAAFGGHGGGDEPIAQELLRKYVAHAKRVCRPKLHQADLDRISRVYAELRKESMVRARPQ